MTRQSSPCSDESTCQNMICNQDLAQFCHEKMCEVEKMCGLEYHRCERIIDVYEDEATVRFYYDDYEEALFFVTPKNVSKYVARRKRNLKKRKERRHGRRSIDKRNEAVYVERLLDMDDETNNEHLIWFHQRVLSSLRHQLEEVRRPDYVRPCAGFGCCTPPPTPSDYESDWTEPDRFLNDELEHSEGEFEMFPGVKYLKNKNAPSHDGVEVCYERCGWWVHEEGYSSWILDTDCERKHELRKELRRYDIFDEEFLYLTLLYHDRDPVKEYMKMTFDTLLRGEGEFEAGSSLNDLRGAVNDMIECAVDGAAGWFMRGDNAYESVLDWISERIVKNCVKHRLRKQMKNILFVITSIILIVIGKLFNAQSYYIRLAHMLLSLAFVVSGVDTATCLIVIVISNIFAKSSDEFESPVTDVLYKMTFLLAAVGFAGMLPTDTNMNNLLRKFDLLPKAITGIEKLTGMLSDGYEKSVDILYEFVYKEKRPRMSSIPEEIEKNYDAVMKLNLDKIASIPSNPVVCAHIQALWFEYGQFRKDFAGNYAVMRFLDAYHGTIKTYFSKATSSNPKPMEQRVKPVCATFYGGSGVGKSSLVNFMIMKILVRRGLITKDTDEKTIEDMLNAAAYPRCKEQIYWDRYQGQLVCVYDDIFQTKDSEVNPNDELFELIRAVNTFSYPLHMADLSQKANTYFTSEFLLATTNVKTVETKSMNERTAVLTRMHLNYAVRVKQQYRKEPNAEFDWCVGDNAQFALDPAKVKERTLEVYEIFRWNPDKGTIDETSMLSVEDVANQIWWQHERHKVAKEATVTMLVEHLRASEFQLGDAKRVIGEEIEFDEDDLMMAHLAMCELDWENFVSTSADDTAQWIDAWYENGGKNRVPRAGYLFLKNLMTMPELCRFGDVTEVYTHVWTALNAQYHRLTGGSMTWAACDVPYCVPPRSLRNMSVGEEITIGIVAENVVAEALMTRSEKFRTETRRAEEEMLRTEARLAGYMEAIDEMANDMEWENEMLAEVVPAEMQERFRVATENRTFTMEQLDHVFDTTLLGVVNDYVPAPEGSRYVLDVNGAYVLDEFDGFDFEGIEDYDGWCARYSAVTDECEIDRTPKQWVTWTGMWGMQNEFTEWISASAENMPEEPMNWMRFTKLARPSFYRKWYYRCAESLGVMKSSVLGSERAVAISDATNARIEAVREWTKNASFLKKAAMIGGLLALVGSVTYGLMGVYKMLTKKREKIEVRECTDDELKNVSSLECVHDMDLEPYFLVANDGKVFYVVIPDGFQVNGDEWTYTETDHAAVFVMTQSMANEMLIATENPRANKIKITKCEPDVTGTCVNTLGRVWNDDMAAYVSPSSLKSTPESGTSKQNVMQRVRESGMSKNAVLRRVQESGASKAAVVSRVREAQVEQCYARHEEMRSHQSQEITAKARKAYGWILQLDGKKYVCPVFNFGGHAALVNKHYWERVPDKFVYQMPGKKPTIEIEKSSVQCTVLNRSGALESDVCVIVWPKVVPVTRNMTGCFLDKDDLCKIDDMHFIMLSPGLYKDTDEVSQMFMHKTGTVTKVSTMARTMLTSGVRTVSHEIFSSDCASEPGDCGGVYILDENAVRGKIVALHYAGAKGGGACGCIVTRQDLEPFVDVDLHCNVDDDIAAELPLDGVIPYGLVAAVSNPTTTQFEPTVVKGLVDDTGMEPVALGRLLKEGGPGVKGLQKVTGHVVCPEPVLLAKSVHSLCDVLFDGSPHREYEKRVLTIEEACAGIPDAPYVQPVNRSRSPGYPWVLGKGGNKGKRKWLGNDEWTFGEEFEPLRQAVVEKEAELKKGVWTPAIYIDSLKDETRPKGKKTRVFSAAPQDFTILFRMYFLGFFSYLMNTRISNEVCVGIKAQSLDWHRLAMKLREKGDAIVAGDFENYDGCLNPYFVWEIVKIINAWYNDGNDRIRELLWHDISSSFHVAEKFLYQWTHSQPSGNPGTTMINSICNSLMCRYVFFYLAREQKITMNFNTHVSMVSYGDDNVLNISDSVITWYNQLTMSAVFPSIGMVYTDANKETVQRSHIALEDASFLKRGFRYTGSMWVGPLERFSINNRLEWQKKGSNTDTLVENAKAAIAEWALHPEQPFREWSSRIRTVLLGRLNRNVPIYEQNYYLDAVRRGDIEEEFPFLTFA